MVEISKNYGTFPNIVPLQSKPAVTQGSFFVSLPTQYRDSRFLAAFNVLSRHVDCSEDTYYKRLNIAEESGDVMSISFMFFKCAVINILNDNDKVLDLQARAVSAFQKDPARFTDVVRDRTYMHNALHSTKPVGELLLLELEDRPEAAKLEYLIYIACLLVLKPVISTESLGVSQERIDQILEYCINIDTEQLEVELARNKGGME